MTLAEPGCWFLYELECETTTFARMGQTARATLTLGYNSSDPSGFTPTPIRVAYIGVRPKELSRTSYTLQARLLPRDVTRGAIVESAMPACDEPPLGGDHPSCRQYFRLDVADFDVVDVKLHRVGNNLTGTGRGLVGAMYSGVRPQLPPASFERKVAIGNSTIVAPITYDCTDETQVGQYVLAVVAGGTADGGFGAEEDLARPAPGRGRFRLDVRHAQYHSGETWSGDSRGGCVTYGQVRTYTINGSSLDPGMTLHVEMSKGNVSFMRARCAECDWVEARPPVTALVASPCQLRNGTSWDIAVGMEDYTPSTIAELAPAEFDISFSLRPGMLLGGGRIEPRSLGGDGYACCGALHTWMLPDVPLTHALTLAINVTRGHIRIAAIKYGTCFDHTADISGDDCRAGGPPCVVSWFTLYDTFYRSREYSYSGFLQVPFGDDIWTEDISRTLRREGDWYVSIEALPRMDVDGSLVDSAAEFEMEIYEAPPPPRPSTFRCTRFDNFCPQTYHGGPRYSNFPPPPAAASGSGSGTSRSRRTGLLWLLPIATALSLASTARAIAAPMDRRDPRAGVSTDRGAAHPFAGGAPRRASLISTPLLVSY